MTTHNAKNVKRDSETEQFSYTAKGELLFFGQKVHASLLQKAKSSIQKHEPVYLYSAHHIRERASLYMQTLHDVLPASFSVHYALKANSNLQILKLLKAQGIGVDVVSRGEMKLALRAGFKPQQILFSGVGKTEIEIREAIAKKIFQLNVESLPELLRIAKLAKQMKIKINIGIRINPGVSPETHPYITTGFKENKFGIDFSQSQKVIDICKKNKFLNYQGLSLHIGSQIFDFLALSEAIDRVLEMDNDFAAQGLPSTTLDLGGGIGVDYSKNAEDIDLQTLHNFTQVLKSKFKNYKKHLCFEPGRFLVARSGLLLTQIQYIKETPYKNFIIVNSGMNHLLRPALYQAVHRILPVLKKGSEHSEQVYDVVGPVCESSDVLGRGRALPQSAEGDWLAIADVGAYGYSMASNYNHFALPKELVLGHK